jgi:stearoyl-CoA desaturase (Delta-9 desaturase)
MLTVAVVVGITALAAVKLAERRMPRAVYKLTLLVGVIAPIAFTGYAVTSLWGNAIGRSELALFAGGYVVTGLGTTIGYHRLITHRSFETGGVVKVTFLALGAMNLQGGPTTWAAFHRKHHALSDREGDPHSPLEGFFHAHVGWLLHAPAAEIERYCRDLLRDPIVRFVDRTAPLWVLVGLAVPYAVAGWYGLVWGGFVRIAFTNHMTFSINSVCHVYGSRPFRTRDESRNNWFMGSVGLGEGWHNNHHAFPAMAYHGIGWRQPDLSALVIRMLVRLRLAWDVKRGPSDSARASRRAVAV